VVVSGADVGGAPGPRILATRSTLYPETEEVMGWDITEKGFRIVLSRDVPEVVLKNLGRDLQEILDEQGLRREDIESWVIHTGGPRVLEATQAAAGIGKRELAASWECLRRTGNLSSASVLFVLEEVMKHRRPAPGTLGVLSAMGPGFCSEIVLLRW
jgi:alkylresorcinol/alkylpyrone synthase